MATAITFSCRNDIVSSACTTKDWEDLVLVVVFVLESKSIYWATASWPGIRLHIRKKGKKDKSVNNGEPEGSLLGKGIRTPLTAHFTTIFVAVSPHFLSLIPLRGAWSKAMVSWPRNKNPHIKKKLNDCSFVCGTPQCQQQCSSCSEFNWAQSS